MSRIKNPEAAEPKKERRADDGARRRSALRTPTRKPGRVRYEAILDSVDALLREGRPEDVGLYQIAEHANIPPASLYHFFPTREAALQGIAQRYTKTLLQCWSAPVAYEALGNWQDLMAWDLQRSVEWFHENVPAMKLFLGGYGGAGAKRVDAEINEDFAAQRYLRLNAAFHMPFLSNPARIFLIYTGITEAIFAVSYLKHGAITGKYEREARDAGLAYCRLYLPARTALRHEHVEAMARGEPIYLGGPR